MNEVFQKTRELGEALMATEEYLAMKAAEEKAMQNAEAAKTMGKFIEQKQRMEELLAQSSPDYTLLKQLSTEIDELQARLQLIDDIAALTSARENFSQLINQVNSVLRFIITGEMENEGDDCTGNCRACSGSCPGSCHIN